jgi:hypothetical protein
MWHHRHQVHSIPSPVHVADSPFQCFQGLVCLVYRHCYVALGCVLGSVLLVVWWLVCCLAERPPYHSRQLHVLK